MKLNYLLLVLQIIWSARAIGLSPANSIGAACVYVANNLTLYPFNCQGQDLDYSCRCKDPSFLGTVLLCIDDNAETPETVTSSYHYVMEICKLQAKQTYKFIDLVTIFTNATKHAIKYENATKYTMLSHPLLPNRPRYAVSRKSVDSILRHRVTTTFFGIGLLGFWSLVAMAGMINNMGVWCMPSIKMQFKGKFAKWLQRHLTNPQLFSRNTNKKRETFHGKILSLFVETLPTRLESLVIILYFTLVVVFCSVDYKIAYPNTIFKFEKCGLLLYIADRAGILAITQLPLMFLFSGRNNVMMVITGWSFRTFIVYHKWISRFIETLIVIHALCYVGYSKQNKDYTSRWTLEKWRWANVATICSGIMIILATRPFRKYMYEVFKTCHQLMAVIFVIGCWNHCKTLGWMEFIYATVAIWAFDHAIRLGKIFVSGGVVMATCEAIMESQQENASKQTEDEEKNLQEKVEGEQVSEDKNLEDNKEELISSITPNKPLQVHSLRVTISHSGWWRDYPGCYVFLYFLRPTCFWQSHPFTVIESSTIETVDQLSIIIRVKEGMTRRLANYIARQPNRIKKIPVLVEGPYGTPIAFRNYQNAVFIAAGVGITVVYTLAADLSRQYRADALREEFDDEEHNVVVVWITPNIKTLEVCLTEIESMGEMPGLNFKIYVTRGYTTPEETTASNYLTKDGSTSPWVAERVRRIINNEVPGIKVKIGKRPKIKKQLVKQVEKLKGNTAIIACGPDSVNRDVRAAAGKWLKSTKSTQQKVDYFEEELLW